MHQFNAFESNNQEANPLGTFESQWQFDSPPSIELEGDITAFLSLMEAGGWAPGSGEQTQTATDAYNIQQYCNEIHAPSGG
jgi:hypothetical protein